MNMRKSATLLALVVIVSVVVSIVTPMRKATAANYTLQYRCNECQAQTNAIKPHVRLYNNTGSAVPLTEITIRYWYTLDGTSSGQTNTVEWAGKSDNTNITNYVSSSVVNTSGKNYYLQLSFSSSAGSIPNGGWVQVENNLHDVNWAQVYNQSDDWSFDGTKTSYAEWDRITVYRNGSLVWGQEPGVSPTPTTGPTPTPAPAVTVSKVWTRSIYPDFVGLNEDAHLVVKGNPWSDNNFKNAYVSLNAGNFRYGGGSQGNYWDWKEGKCDSAINYNNILVPWWFPGYVNSQQSHTLDNLKIGMQASGDSVVFMLNIVTDNEGDKCGTPQYQIDMLKYWKNTLGMPLKYIELGNEVYACWEEGLICLPPGQSNADPNATPKYQNIPDDYTRQMADWITAIRNQLGNDVKIALTGASSPIPNLYDREGKFNKDLNDNFNTGYNLFGSNRANAVTIHHYYETGSKSPGSTPINTFIVDGLESWHWSLDTSMLSYFTNPGWSNVHIWVTEFNIDGDGSSNYYNTWEQNLYLIALLNEMLKESRINLFNYHGAYGGNFGAIDTSNNLTKQGYLIQMLGQAMTGMTSAERYSFSTTPYLDGNNKYPAYIGWAFTNGTTRRAIVANLTGSSVVLDPSGFNISDKTYRTMTASSIPGSNQSYQTTITLPAYSITLIGTGASVPTPTPTRTPTPGPTNTPTRTPTPSGPTPTPTKTPTPTSSPTNLLENPGFESGTTNWTCSSCSLSTVSSPVHSGSKAASVTNRTAAWAGPRQDITTDLRNNGQGNYYIEAWFRMASGSATTKATIQVKASTTSYFGVTCSATSTNWVKCSGTKNITWSGTLQSATFYLETTSGTTSFYADDCILRKQ